MKSCLFHGPKLCRCASSRIVCILIITPRLFLSIISEISTGLFRCAPVAFSLSLASLPVHAHLRPRLNRLMNLLSFIH
jgi:hypothetical protein